MGKLSELIEQALGLFEVERLQALAKPTISRCEQVAGLVTLTSIMPEPRETGRGPQFPRLRLLLSCDRKRTREMCFCFTDVRLGSQQSNLSSRAMDVGLNEAAGAAIKEGSQ